MVSKNVGKPTISHRPFPTFYNRRLHSGALGLEFLVLESISIPKVLGPNLKSH